MTDRNRLIDLLDEVVYGLLDGAQIEAIAEHLLANGVILPPVKAGDTLYAISNSRITVCTCLDVMIDDGIAFLTEHICEYECKGCPFSSWGQDYSGEHSCSGENGYWTFSQDDIGKTVFLTEADAQKALKERDRQWTGYHS